MLNPSFRRMKQQRATYINPGLPPSDTFPSTRFGVVQPQEKGCLRDDTGNVAEAQGISSRTYVSLASALQKELCGAPPPPPPPGKLKEPFESEAGDYNHASGHALTAPLRPDPAP